MSAFVCLEGVDGVGKTEISKRLAEQLGYRYYKSPGGKFASARSIVDDDVDPLTRYFFYRAATQYDSRKIAQILQSSGVVCDRYIYSTFAFHGAMDAQIQSLFEFTQLIMPDYVFVLTAREEIRKQRLRQRPDTNDLDFNLSLQRQADRIFRTFNHRLVDTSDTTVDEAVKVILSHLAI